MGGCADSMSGRCAIAESYIGRIAIPACIAVTIRRTVTLLLITATLAVVPCTAHSQQQPANDETIQAAIALYLERHPEKLSKAVEAYLQSHPETLQAAIETYVQARTAAKAAEAATKRTAADANTQAAIERNKDALFASPHQMTVNPEGAPTLVAFIDYNCGYCRRSYDDLRKLMAEHPKLRVVLKELPVLGEPSREAAAIVIAARMQDAGGSRALTLHQKLLGEKGPINKARAMTLAVELGFDPEALERDVASGEVRTTIEESLRLAGELSIRGTPSYVVGNDVVRGAAGFAALNEKIKAAQK